MHKRRNKSILKFCFNKKIFFIKKKKFIILRKTQKKFLKFNVEIKIYKQDIGLYVKILQCKPSMTLNTTFATSAHTCNLSFDMLPLLLHALRRGMPRII